MSSNFVLSFYSPEDLQRRDQEPPSDVPVQEERRLPGPVRHRQLLCEGEEGFYGSLGSLVVKYAEYAG